MGIEKTEFIVTIITLFVSCAYCVMCSNVENVFKMHSVKVVNLASIKFGDLGLRLSISRTLNLAISRFLEKLNMDFLNTFSICEH